MSALRISKARAVGVSRIVPYAILAVMIATMVLLPVVTSYTLRTAYVYDILQNFSSYGLVALALGITIMAGEFDLSVSSMYLLGGMVAVLTGNGSPLAGVLAALGAAVIVGCVQGGLISYFRLNSMPVTLGGYLVVLGLTYILGHSKSVIYENYDVGLRLDEPIAQVFSIRSLITLGIFVLAALALRYLRVGRDIRSIGGDRRAARVAGVRVDRLLVFVFIMSAIGAALPGALLSYSLATASPTNIGFDVLTFSATAALLGGVSLSGGRGSPVGIAAGVLSLSVLQEILSIVRSPDYVSSLITGGLLVAVTILWAPDISRWFKTTRVATAHYR
ncbi:MAG: ribose transport system permease protein [Gaiellaceae bacterium]|jgi:ribose/xylose/arabinose/galactoside ABC-type transport system permease subunit|nr:ribose transport system permease protein [Gaiellaceae bacterium]